MASALGLPARALGGAQIWTRDLEQPLPLELTAPEVRRKALLGRADVQGALAAYAASQSALQLAIAGQYPDIHLGPGYAWNTGSAGDNEYQLGLTVTLPVLNRNRGAIAEAAAKRREAAAAFVSIQAQAIGQIDNALAGYRAALGETRAAAALLTRLDQRLRAVHSMEHAGQLDPLAVANAQVEFSAGALSRWDAVVKARLALARLEDAVQSSLTLPARAIQTAQAQHER